MKVCLVRPPSIINPLAYIGSLTPPIGLAYIAAALRHAGHEVEIVDGIGENPDQSTPLAGNLVARGLTFDQIVARIRPDADMIGISGMFSSEWTQIRELVNRISAAFPKTPLVAGGEHFTAASELSMRQCPRLKICVVGEGEETIVELADALSRGANLETVPGLALRRDGGAFVKTATRPRLREVDAIHAPAWDLVPLENYLSRALGYGVNRGRSMPMLASRGCPYECTFCSSPLMWTTRWVARDPGQLIDEIEGYVRKYDITNVDFYDLTAIVKRDWILAFCKGLHARKLDITWQLPSGTRSEAIDAEVSHWLYKSGCRNMNYAPESGSERTLENIKKKVKLDRLCDSLRGAVKNNLNVKINIIIGLPDETHWDVLQTIAFLVKLSWYGAHDVSVGVFAPYPGSELYERLVAEKKITNSDEYFGKLAYVDITETVSFTDHISSDALRFYNWAAFFFFYASNYLFRPQRFVRTVRNLMTRRHESRGEMALSALLSRLHLAPAVKQF
ncbi:MAG: B12-binding domain-containing radical SAM protein [Elusimicrobia bacterium]|nr:B12-binding domain-containing radical SAM protein [Elusimicrobiota bacterium]